MVEQVGEPGSLLLDLSGTVKDGVVKAKAKVKGTSTIFKGTSDGNGGYAGTWTVTKKENGVRSTTEGAWSVSLDTRATTAGHIIMPKAPCCVTIGSRLVCWPPCI